MIYLIITGALISFVLTWLMTLISIKDVPNHRSNHTEVTPTSGGVAVLSLVLISGAFFLFMDVLAGAFGGGPNIDQDLTVKIMGLLFALGILGLIDDMKSIPTSLKFLILILMSALAVWWLEPVQKFPLGSSDLTLPYVIGFLGAVLWVFVVTNVVNFMDGSNGIMAVSLIIAGYALFFFMATTGNNELFWLPFSISVGLMGFLPFNLRKKARVFSGDVGSLPIGFGFAVSVLSLVNQQDGRYFPRYSDDFEGSYLFIGPLLLLPFLTDVLLTLVRRVRRRENILSAHSQHLYQRLIRAGLSHVFVAWMYGLMALLMAAYVFLLLRLELIDKPLALIGPALALSAVYFVVSRRLN